MSISHQRFPAGATDVWAMVLVVPTFAVPRSRHPPVVCDESSRVLVIAIANHPQKKIQPKGAVSEFTNHVL